MSDANNPQTHWRYTSVPRPRPVHSHPVQVEHRLVYPVAYAQHALDLTHHARELQMRQDERLLLIPHRTPPLADSPVGCEYPALAVQPLTQAEMGRHTDLTNRAAFGLVQGCLEAEVPPGLVANVLLDYWLRASTINANMSETMCSACYRPSRPSRPSYASEPVCT